MISRGQVFVRGIKANGSPGSVDVLDLDEISFRAFVLDMLMRRGAVVAVEGSLAGESVVYRERLPDVPLKSTGG